MKLVENAKATVAWTKLITVAVVKPSKFEEWFFAQTRKHDEKYS